MDHKAAVQQAIDSRRQVLVELSEDIHAHPELAFDEHTAARLCEQLLKAEGFRVESGVADMPTAFRATVGDGPLHVAFCAEYDALPGIGHACGHNLIAASSIAAALGLRDFVDALGLTVTVLGTPAEESGSGKVLMLDRGLFEGVHAVMAMHPNVKESSLRHALALSVATVEYSGRSAHASNQPFAGVNAVDALTVAQVAIGLMRQQLPIGARVYGVPQAVEGAPNVIPSFASAEYYVRAPDIATHDRAREQLLRCFEAGAVATGCEMRVHSPEPPLTDFENDLELAALYRSNMGVLGRDCRDDDSTPSGSTDLANVSHVVPTIHPQVFVDAGGALPHQRGFTDAVIGTSAESALFDAATALAWTTVDAATDAELRDRLIRGRSGGTPTTFTVNA